MTTKTSAKVPASAKFVTIDPTFDWSRCKCGARFQTTAELDKHFHAEHKEH